MRTTLTLVGLLAFASFSFAAPRLALLPEDATPETTTRLELLTAALTKGGQVDLVERAELQRVLAEQKLSAAGIVAPEAVLTLAKLLRAEGILFLSREDSGKVVTARLVETRQGLIAGLWRYRPGTDPVEKTVSQLAADIRAGAAKLASVGEKPLLVSVLRIGNATLDAEFLWVEDELPLLLGSLLSRDPRVLLLERRQLSQLLDETQTSAGGAAAFRAAGILLDADLALKPGVTIDPDRTKRALVLTVRLRTPQLLELASVSAEGTAGQLDRLTTEAATQLLARLHELKSIPATGDAKAEAKLFMEVAALQGTTAAADAAHALVPGDEAALRNLMESLMRRVPPKKENDEAALAEATREWARNLARAADMVRGRIDSSLADAFALHALGSECPLLSQPRMTPGRVARRDPEAVAYLRSAGQVARLVLEYRRARWTTKIEPWEILRSQWTFVDDDLAMVAYMEPLLMARLDSKGDRSPRWRGAVYDLFYGLTWFSLSDIPQSRKWQGFLRKTLSRPEPEVLYLAHASLALLEKDPSHIQEVARLLPALFEGSDEWLASERAAYMMRGSLGGVARLWQTESVECIGPVFQKVVAKELAAGRTGALVTNLGFLETFPYQPALAPPSVALTLLEKGLALAETQKAKLAALPATPETQDKLNSLSFFIPNATKLRERLQAQLPRSATPAAAPAIPGVGVLWRSGAPEWLAAFRDVQLQPGDVPLVAPCCFVAGGTVWGVLFGRATIVFRVDARTGRLLSTQVWELSPEQVALRETTTRDAAKQIQRGHLGVAESGGPWIMCRWRDSVCLTMWGLGVCLVPANAAGKADVRAIGRQQGLPALDLIGVAPAGDTLYIASRQALVAAAAGQEQVKLVVNLAGDTTASSLPRDWAIHGLVADRAGKNLYLLLREAYKTPPPGYKGPLWEEKYRNCAVWGLEIGSGQWRLVRGNLILNLGSRAVASPFQDPAKPAPVPPLPSVPGTADAAANYLVRWADELQGLRMATLPDGSMLVAERNAADKECVFYRAPAPPPPAPK